MVNSTGSEYNACLDRKIACCSRNSCKQYVIYAYCITIVVTWKNILSIWTCIYLTGRP